MIRRIVPGIVPVEYDAPGRAPALPRIPRTAPTSLPLARPAPWPPAGALGVDDAVALAVDRSPTLRARIAEVERLVALVYQTASGYQPHVEIKYSAVRYQQPLGAPFQTTIIGNSVRIQAAPFTLSQFEDRLQLAQLLSDGGHTRLLIQADIALARAGMADLVQATMQLQHEVRTAYIAVLEARAQVGVAEETLSTAEEHLRMARAQFDAGVVARADITFSTTPVTRARIGLHNARTAVETRMAHLLSLVGGDPTRPVALADLDLADPPGDLLALRGLAARERADLHARRDEIAAASAGLDAARRSRSVNVQANAGYRQVGYQTREIVPQHTGWSAGLELTYPLLDGGLITAQVKEARARLDAARAREEALSRDVDEQVVTAWLELGEAKDRLELATAEVEQAQESLSVARGQYEAGVGTNLQVLDAQVVLARARIDAVNSRYAVARARARLLLAIGR